MDTGSHLSTLNNDVLKDMHGVHVKPTRVKTRSYSGNINNFLGEAELMLKYKDVSVAHTFLIVNSNCVSLLGRDLCNKLNIKLKVPSTSADLDSPVHAVQNNILIEFKDYLSDDFKANVTKAVSLEVKENVTPIFCKSRSVPVRLRDLVKKELQQLEHEGIITKVFTSEWASPTVCVLKSDNKSVRICGDYSATINKNLKLNQCPLPSVDEVISRVGNSSIFSKN